MSCPAGMSDIIAGGKVGYLHIAARNPVVLFSNRSRAGGHRRNATLSGLEDLPRLPQGSSQARNPGLNDTIPLGLSRWVECFHPLGLQRQSQWLWVGNLRYTPRYPNRGLLGRSHVAAPGNERATECTDTDYSLTLSLFRKSSVRRIRHLQRHRR